MSAAQERPTKRRNLARWREARLRRLEWESKKGRATERQVDRINQLAALLGMAQGGAA